MRLIFAKKLGFCSGVKRAISLAQSIPKRNNKKGTVTNPVHTLGPLIHNPQEVERLEKRGVKAISRLNQIKTGTLIVPSHGLPRSILKKIEKKRLKLIDATCPFVKRAQLLAKSLHNRGYHVVIVGQKSHPEVISLLSFANGDASVVETPVDVDKLKTTKKIGVISQTTQSVEKFEKIVERLKTKVKKLKIHNTICKETSQRQKEAKGLAEKSDLMIVIGGKNSANTARLYEICKKVTRAHHMESPAELRLYSFNKKGVVGITSGTSTPDWIIRSVVKGLHKTQPG
ncbi:4-hydroxy-3-methylbut-2-enyl diphosphate reductase [bacterium]|nr:4-hydroxy-3-methylbut-2-enyl diphosphate reductase [bacterium]NIN93383.1 4-hydroxy-3-methylbut-2-enyl diphosphate reductase [bacterium]NIO19159.1 4-hydroxy-3-methylbut-2-enyl diphosphate reductase [bacterium]NIO74294.1 4-hydroxy-3-methylbut-2-enyl diphosphate reductase [bacterium]